MSTPLSSGNYFIFNVDSSRFILAKSTAKAVDSVKTTDTDASDADNRISVSYDKTSGQYTFRRLDTVNTPSQGLYLALGNDKSGNPIVQWSGSSHLWSVSNDGPGLWNVISPGVNSYWSDSASASDHTIELVAKASQGDRVQWKLIAA
jgi:hypothetical protein